METNNPLAAPTLRDFLFNNESLESIKPTTKSIGDTALVIVRPVYVGKLCQAFDAEEEIFHVEFASNVDKTWAEIWLAKEWKESNTRRNRIQTRSVEERQTREVRNKRVYEISSMLKSAGLDKKPGFVEHLAGQILQSWKEGKYNELLSLLKLTDKLQNYDQEDKETKEKISQVSRELGGNQNLPHSATTSNSEEVCGNTSCEEDAPASGELPDNLMEDADGSS